jgi:hypothetical protein
MGHIKFPMSVYDSSLIRALPPTETEIVCSLYETANVSYFCGFQLITFSCNYGSEFYLWETFCTSLLDSLWSGVLSRGGGILAKQLFLFISQI